MKIASSRKLLGPGPAHAYITSMRHILLTCILATVPSAATPTATNTTSPTVTLTGVNATTVVTTGVMTVGARVSATVVPVTAVEFRASYLDDFGDNFDPQYHDHLVAGQLHVPERNDSVLIGRDSLPPYEIAWDLRDVPDQDGRSLTLWAVALLADGSRIRSAPVWGTAIDRNPVPGDRRITARYRRGREVPREADNTVGLALGTDSLTAHLSWDAMGLFIHARVRDAYLHAPCDTLPDGTLGLAAGSAYWNDCVIMTFDPQGDRGPRMDDDDFTIMVSPVGRWYNHGYVAHNRPRTDSLAAEIYLDLHRQGTLNNPADTDTGYFFELFLPWELFGIEPGNGTEMGFDIGLTDRDGVDKIKNTASWSGLVKRNRCNPTEWGRIELAGRTASPVMPGLLVLIGIAGITGFLYYRKKQRKPPTAGTPPPVPAAGAAPHPLVARTDELIRTHLAEPNLNISFIAAELGTKSGYLGKLYKNEKGTGILDEIHRLRIEKADTLLAASGKTVAEIGFEIGYNSPQYFIRMYRKMRGTTPSQSA